MGKGTEWTFFQRSYSNGQCVHEKILSITNIREMQIKTTMRYHVTPEKYQYHIACLDYSIFTLSLEVGQYQSSIFALPLQYCIGYSGSFASCYIFQNHFVSIQKITFWDLIWIALKLQIKLGRTDILWSLFFFVNFFLNFNSSVVNIQYYISFQVYNIVMQQFHILLIANQDKYS